MALQGRGPGENGHSDRCWWLTDDGVDGAGEGGEQIKQVKRVINMVSV